MGLLGLVLLLSVLAELVLVINRIKNMISREDFKVSGDTMFWSIFILIIGIVILSSIISYKMGIFAEKIGWLEDQTLELRKGGK